ncbi:MAG: trypsin-like peptidase domain-containing protein [Bdellovibrionota bacterium]
MLKHRIISVNGLLIPMILGGYIANSLFTAAIGFSQDFTKIRRSVFKIRVVSQEPNFERPWEHESSKKSSGTGFYIGNNLILTNAHVVANSRYLTVQRDGDSNLELAAVVHIAHDCDLAVITTQRKNYFQGIAPLSFGSLPKLRSPVSTIGFPKGGEQLSITEGIVSRVGYRSYVHSRVNKHLLVQVDSAINPGNSGGPVVQKDKVVGVAFQSFISAENTGYIIPTPVILRFLKDIEDGHYDGHIQSGLQVSPWAVSNSANKLYYDLNDDSYGVVVSYVYPWSSLNRYIKKGDLLLKIDGNQIGADGKIDFQGERVNFDLAYDLRQLGDSIHFVLKRGREVRKFNVKIEKNRSHYFKGSQYIRRPKYYIYGGLVFSTLSYNFLKSWGNKWYERVPAILKYLHYNSDLDMQFATDEEFIVLVDRLPHSINAYLTKQENEVVEAVNGQRVNSLQRLATILDSLKSEYVKIEFMGDVEPAVMRTSDVAASKNEILSQYKVDRDRWLIGDEMDGANLIKTGDKK